MKQPPSSVCILRLSAIGDVTHMVPVVRTLQKHWPNTKLTWIIGKNEASLVQDFPDIEFIEFDKSHSFTSYRHLSKVIKKRVFDVLICAQVSLRANFISSLINAKLKLGYDKARAKDLHRLFIDESIPANTKQHVLDSFFSFIEYLGLHERELTWDYIIPEEAHKFAEKYIDKNRFNLIISPCSSHPKRNWRSEYYAAVADFAATTLDAQIILCGGPSKIEIKTGQEIEQHMQTPAINLIGKDTLKKFLAILKRADAIITPDSGPAHMATGFNTPVIGLHAASNPNRSGPYLSQNWCIDKYDEAAVKFNNKSSGELKWGTKLEYDGVMDLISVEDVVNKLTLLSKQQTKSRI
ncbi:MAG: glycosyltransferase family 9 protein [Gammaproteobacteria bacterium]